jgi:ABC-2 type transport system ATP-binding protein
MTATASPLVVETHGLTRRFGSLVAVDGVDLEIRRGEIFGFLGPNGSGKSTLLRMLLGLLRPSEGSARVLGLEVPRDIELLRAEIGYMTQRFSLYDDLTVFENLDFAAQIFGLAGRRRRERVDAALAESGLSTYRDARAAALSGGWKQRLALAVATIHEPPVLVLDEPTAGVDPQSRRDFWGKLFGLAAGGTTVLVSTHYMDEAVRCHRICMLKQGRRAALGAPRELIESLAGRVLDVRCERVSEVIDELRHAPHVASLTQLGVTAHALLERGAPPAAEIARTLREFLDARGHREAIVEPSRANLEDVFVALLLGERLQGGQERAA